MAKEIELYLQNDGFYAGKKLKNGEMSKDSHKITEDEITIMFTTLLRTFVAKTGKDTIFLQDDDGHAVVAKLIEVKTETGEKSPSV